MKVAAIRIRGETGIKTGIKKTLGMLRLYRKNYCVVLEGTPSVIGMLKKINDYATWGEMNEEIFKMLVQKRGKEYKGRAEDKKGIIRYKALEIGGKKLK